MKALFVFLFLVTLPFLAFSENEKPEDGIKDIASAVKAEDEDLDVATVKYNIDRVALGLTIVGSTLVIAADNLHNPPEALLYGAGWATAISGCAVAWGARIPRNPKKKLLEFYRKKF